MYHFSKFEFFLIVCVFDESGTCTTPKNRGVPFFFLHLWSVVVAVVVLLFYVHGKHLRSCWDGQLT